jgi:hypothetical protein
VYLEFLIEELVWPMGSGMGEKPLGKDTLIAAQREADRVGYQFAPIQATAPTT